MYLIPYLTSQNALYRLLQATAVDADRVQHQGSGHMGHFAG